MCFSPSPPLPTPKAIFSSNLTFDYKCSSDSFNLQNTSCHTPDKNKYNTFSREEQRNMQQPEDIANVNISKTEEETASDYKQWLHAMKLVARLPGGIPPEFRRKLWLSLADKYLKSKNVNWSKEEEKCFCEKWREDDEELGIQIVKDLHRTGSTFCTGPTGDLNQAKLKRILLGYARYNPQVGYCQGFNMLGALILQVMEKNEAESIKVMIYLVEGILPTGYFCGSMGGLQADMAVFRELMLTKLPRLAKHLQKLQGPIENAYEPPLTNVFTMQWFLTMFCTCLPMSCVLRIWDLVLIEGSDVLLRTALALWSLLEERVLSTRSADDFYGKMGSFSSELLNGHLIDSNGLIEKVVQLGPIADIQMLRDKHLYNVAPIERPQGLKFYFDDDDEPDIDEDSRLAIATVWGIPWGRRGSQCQPSNVSKQPIESKDRIALDISLLKKQYDKLRERQKQAQIILTTACTTASRQNATTVPLAVNQLLAGRPAIVTNRGRRSGPLTGAIPPARKPSLPAVLHDKPLEKHRGRGETLYWRDINDTEHRRDSLSWKEIKAERATMITSGSIDGLKSQKIRSGRFGKSDSSSYSEESDENDDELAEGTSSTDTSLCDDNLQSVEKDKKQQLHMENNVKSSSKTLYKSKKTNVKQRTELMKVKRAEQKVRPKSWAPSNTEIPFMLMAADSPENSNLFLPEITDNNITYDTGEKALTEEKNLYQIENVELKDQIALPTGDELAILNLEATPFNGFEDIMPKDNISILDRPAALGSGNEKHDKIGETFDISNEGVTNEYFERINGTERPTKLNLLYSLNQDENVRSVFNTVNAEFDESDDKSLNKSNNIRSLELLVDYSEKSSAACIEEAKTEISTTLQMLDTSPSVCLKTDYPSFKKDSSQKRTKNSIEKRRDPRRLTLTRSSTMDIEKRYEAFEKRFSMEISSNYTRFLDETEYNKTDSNKEILQNFNMDVKKADGNKNDSTGCVHNYKILCAEKLISVDKKIPSTADLELRFENIQQQLVRDRNRKIKSPCDSENSESQSNFNTSLGINIAERTQKGNANKEIKPRDADEDDVELDGGQIFNAHSDIEKKSPASNDVKEISKGSITVDVDGIINITERSAPKIKPSSQNKEEPPDDIKYDDDINASKEGLSKTYRSKNDINSNTKILENTKKEKQAIEKSHGTVKKISERISPPSTQELEKRFCALEEQKRSTKNESIEVRYSAQHRKGKNSEAINGNTVNSLTTSNIDNENLGENGVESSHKEGDTVKTSLTKFEISEKSIKRRLSEPPSTEDLEKRYEVLKRRMSSRNFETKSSHKELPAIEILHEDKNGLQKKCMKAEDKQSIPPTENLEDRFEKLQSKNGTKNQTSVESLPFTEELKEGLENPQDKNETTAATLDQSVSLKQNLDEHLINNKEKKCESELHNNRGTTEIIVSTNGEGKSRNEEACKDNGSNSKISPGNDCTLEKLETAPDIEENLCKTNSPINSLAKNINKVNVKLMEELEGEMNEYETSAKEANVIVEELESKIDREQAPLKDTQICFRRPSPSQSMLLPSLSFNDEILESHATSAFCRSEKHEPKNTANRKTVRRFSDLPSRADLENRLKFLEEQLSKTVRMQRRSSDSEVASKAKVRASHCLEYRVQELEKRLRENATLPRDIACLNTNGKHLPDIEISQLELSTDDVAVTGKELVRYSSHGEAVDVEHQNPINININIQMTLNKEDIGGKHSTGELDKRLHSLEQKLQATQVHDAFETITSNVVENVIEQNVDRVIATDNEDAKVEDNHQKHENTQYVDQPNNKNIDAVCNSKSNLVSKPSDNIKIENGKGFAAKMHVEPGPVNKISENVQMENCTEEAKPVQNNLTKGGDSGELGSKSEAIKTNENLENVKKIKKSDEYHENEKSAKQTLLKKEEKEILCNATETTATEDKAITQTKSEDKFMAANIQTESKHGNENIQTEANEVCDLKLRVNKNEIGELDEAESIGNVNAKLKTTPEIEKFVGLNNCSQFVPVEVNKKTLVLLLDNEPKAVKVRRLTRANTQELEDLFQALEKQLNDRGHKKMPEKEMKSTSDEVSQNNIEISNLAKEIEAYSKSDPKEIDKASQETQKKEEEQFDWGSDPIKYHLKKRTVYLPSTKELEARFRSLERQIKILEDAEKIDVEQRLVEIERKIKLQYSLSHEKDLNKFLELCEGKEPDELFPLENNRNRKEYCNVDVPAAHKCNTCHTSPNRLRESNQRRNVDYCCCSLNQKRSKSKQNLKKQLIHPLEMLLDSSPDNSDIPTTGELEHRIRVMQENRCTPPSPLSRKSRSQSPPFKHNKTHVLEEITSSPTERELPTAEELEARLEALEKEQCFNFKLQKNFQQFNQKLKDVVSPSLSFDDHKSLPTHYDSGQNKIQPYLVSKPQPISPKTIRFYEEDRHLYRKEIESSMNTASLNKESQPTATPITREGIGVMGIRLMKETSPLRRKGTHTGIALRTGENINDQLTSIQNTIKSIDTLCEEKPYRKERCQQYIDSLFSDSMYFAHKKTSLDDLTSHNISKSATLEIGHPLKIPDHSAAFSRSMGSADSIQSSNPLVPSSSLQYRSNRDLRRETSPRRRQEENREEHESRVRRDNLLPNIINYRHSTLTNTSHNSLTKFHKVDSQLIPNDVVNEHEREQEESLRHPTTFNTIGKTIYSNTITSNDNYTTQQRTHNPDITTPGHLKTTNWDKHMSPINKNTPVYTPTKLEIRHTTVTSTFYDRVLTEKQLEKQQHLSFSTKNQSPLISPQCERNVRPFCQQHIKKSPIKLLYNDAINTITLGEVPAGNYHRSYQPFTQNNNRI